MKKILTLALALILVLTMGISALATGYTGEVTPLHVILTEASSGDVIYAKDEYGTAYSAGLVKLMTAYVTVKSIDDLDSIVTVSSAAFSSLDAEDITLYPMLSGGEEISVRDLLGAMIVASGNDAALALATYIGGSTSGFVDLMNQYADELGMTGTKYTNPTGKHYGSQYTTAYDLTLLVSELLKYPELMDIFSAVSYTIPATNYASERTVYNTNRLICEYSEEESFLYDYATGMIAGYTFYSGSCIAATAEKDGTELICIILGDVSYSRNERWTLAADLFDYGFSLYTPLYASDILADIPLSYTDDEGTEYTVTPDFTGITVRRDVPDVIEVSVITQDNEIGTAVYTDDSGILVAEVPVTLAAIQAEKPAEPQPQPEPEPSTPAVPDEPAKDEEPVTSLPDKQFNAKPLLAIGISVVVLAVAFLLASISAKSKSKGRHASANDSFRVKFRQNFMTWLLFGIIAVVIIVIVCVILL